jgi:hypothetical protein
MRGPFFGGGKLNAQIQARSSSFGTDNRCFRGFVCSGRTTYAFAIRKSVGSPAGRLHLCWSLPIRTFLGVPRARMLVCTLRRLLWRPLLQRRLPWRSSLLGRSLAVPVKPLALALLAHLYGRFEGAANR